jgi:3',5'-cyclic AMP phosphodiesterase CpdA
MVRTEYRRVARDYFGHLAHTGVIRDDERRVPLLARVIIRPADAADEHSNRKHEAVPERPLVELLRVAEPRAALVARPGAGKTTALLLHALALASAQDGPLPVFVPLRELDGGYADLEALIAQCMGRVVPGCALGDLRDGPWVILLDGVNERTGTGDPFARLMANYPQVPMLFTTREPAFHLGQQIELLPLAPGDRDGLIAAWIPDQAPALQRRLAEDRRLDELSRTPLLLALLCDAARGGLTPGGTRVALIRASVACHARRYAAKAGAEAFPAARLDAWLGALAHAMLERGTLQIDDLAAEEVLGTAPGAPPDPRTLLRHLTAFHLLAHSAPGVIEFVHPLVHEFYAAQHLRGSRALPDRRTLVRDYINRTLWTEPLRLFAEECNDPAIGASLIDATRDVDEMLAARLVGSFPPTMQTPLFDRLLRASDTPGTRLTRVISVGTAAATHELVQLAVHPDSEVRFQVADCLWDFSAPEVAAINAGLLSDASLSVVNAAAHNLRRHPAPVDALLAALQREDVWGCRPPYALPFLVRALLQSDTDAAAACICELARAYLALDGDEFNARAQEPYATVHSALLSDPPAPSVARGLTELLGELGGRGAWSLLQLLSHSTAVVDLEPALVGHTPEHCHQLIDWALTFPGRFTVSDERLLAAIQYSARHDRLDDTNRLFAAAKARRCRGLVTWLAQLVAGESLMAGWYIGSALKPLLALDTQEAVQAATRALAADAARIRRCAAEQLCRDRSPALAELRTRAMAMARADLVLAADLVGGHDVELATEILERVLEHHPQPAARRVVEAFWQRLDISRFIARLRNKQERHLLAWPKDMSASLRQAFTRSLLGSVDLALTELFLDSRIWRDLRAIVVPYLEQIVETGDHEAVGRALHHLSEEAWCPPLATYVRLLVDGHSRYAMRRPEADPDSIFIAFHPLLRHENTKVRAAALEQLYPPPPNHLPEFVALLDDPVFERRIAKRIIHAPLYAEFPALLRRPGLIVAQRSDAPIEESNEEDPDDAPIVWHSFEWTVADAPIEVLGECVAILADRYEAAWDRPFLDLFKRAPAFRHHARVLACLRRRDPFAADQAFEALLRKAETAEELALLDSYHDDPELGALSIAKAFADVARPGAAPLVLARLARLVDSHEGSEHEVIRHSLAAWWMRLLGQVASASEGAQLAEMARRTDDVWLSQSLYRTAAEIQQRTGIYHLRHTTMPRPWTLLHLSDLHFSTEDQPERWHSALAEDLRRELHVDHLDAMVLSGDIVDRACITGYPAAERFIARICDEFHVPRERVVIVPGNHDIDRSVAAPVIQRVRRTTKKTPPAHDFAVADKLYAITDRVVYERRLATFADFFTRCLDRPYPLDAREQAGLWIWPELEVVVLGLSSVGELDSIRPGHAMIDDTALSRALEPLRREANHYLKLAVFHHPLNGPGEDRIRDAQFLDRLAVAGFSLVLHGHVHQADNAQLRYDRTPKGRRIEVVGAGTFGARTSELPTGSPWQYNLLRFTGHQVRVETRRREADNTAWKPHACWTTGAGEAPQAWYDLALSRA